ncbi:MAG: hypothetical protein JHD34_05480 [Candidatus Nanopelagicus sp.]|jgi:hypothetical protein|nr:hypothetical protein [Candidatus Nanopelagicus sp.]
MNENELIAIWNQQRAIRVKSQLAPTVLLSAVLALAATGNLTKNSDSTLKLFVIGLVASGGVFSVSAMVAAIRDSLAVIDALKGIKSISPLGKSIKKSSDQLKVLGGLFMVMSAFNFVVLLRYLSI